MSFWCSFLRHARKAVRRASCRCTPGPDHLEFVNYIFAERDVSEDIKRDMLQNGIQQTGTSGTIEQDDSDIWPQIMRNARRYG
jgi:hypothetical protein